VEAAVTTAARVLDVARSQLGVAETPVNRQLYGRAYGWDGQPWCMQFAWWVLTQAGCAAQVPKTASTVVARDWYMQRGQWHARDPQPGDLVFFKFAGNSNPVNHVGFVEGIDAAGTLITIEGNTTGDNTGDQRNGGMVARKRRLTSVVGFARPAYAREDDELSQAQVDQIIRQLRSDIGFARDQILTRLGVPNPESAPAKLPPEQLAPIDPARRVDVGWARDQLMGQFAEVKGEQDRMRRDIDALFDLVEAVADKVGVPRPPAAS